MKNKNWAIIFLIFWCGYSIMLDASVGKLIITGFDGYSKHDVQVQLLKKRIDQSRVGGVIIYGRNVKNKLQLRSLISYLTENTTIIVAIDHEGGLVNRLNDLSFGAKLPSPELFCRASLLRQRQYAEQHTMLLHQLGVNVNFGGVLDIKPLIHSSSVCKDSRCFSNKYETVMACFSILNQAYRQRHIVYGAKHYPGHGSTSIDSHQALPDITQTHTDYDLMPYIELSKRKSLLDRDMPNSRHFETVPDMVMVGHLMDKTIDKEYPASLSSHHINYLTNVIGFGGIIITDDLNMGALKHVVKDKNKLALLALNAGNHLLLFEKLTMSQIDQMNQFINFELKNNQPLNLHVKNSIQRRHHLLN